MLSVLLLSCATTEGTGSGSAHDFNPLLALVEFYRGPLNHLSAVKKGHCPMYPSCSEYCMQCLRKHGFLMGWIMSCDRLMRCGRDEMTLSPMIPINGDLKCYDPVENNDAWWSEPSNSSRGSPGKDAEELFK